jgi:hypothetical protein
MRSIKGWGKIRNEDKTAAIDPPTMISGSRGIALSFTSQDANPAPFDAAA